MKNEKWKRDQLGSILTGFGKMNFQEFNPKQINGPSQIDGYKSSSKMDDPESLNEEWLQGAGEFIWS